MTRQEIEMEPKTLDQLRGGNRLPRRLGGFDVEQLRRDLGSIAEVRAPEEAEEPILAPAVRAAMFSWMTEIRAAEDLQAVGLKPRTTALLYGPPGCGKTTLAHHFAARLGVPMVTAGVESIVGEFHGQSERNMGRLFDVLAAAEHPCVLFLDEIDAIGMKRQADRGGGAQNSRNSTLTVLLRKIEAYRGYALAATNRQDQLDPALWRRFHMQIAIDMPGLEERFAILKRYAAPFTLPDEDLDLLTDLTAGASPALLRAVMEGMKRALVIAPRINRPAEDPVALFEALAIANSPPPEIPPPPLWSGHTFTKQLRALTWPPERAA